MTDPVSTAISQQAERLRKRQAKIDARKNASQPTLGAGPGKLQELGQNPVSSRGNISSGSTPIGSPVSNTQGLVGGMPGSVSDRRRLDSVSDRLASVARARGAQIGAFDPNDTTGVEDGSGEKTIQPHRYPFDFFWSTSEHQLYYWQPSTATEAGLWTAFGLGALTDVTVVIESPSVQSYVVVFDASVRWRVLGASTKQLTNLDADWDGNYALQKKVPSQSAVNLITDASNVSFNADIEKGESILIDIANVGSTDVVFSVKLLGI